MLSSRLEAVYLHPLNEHGLVCHLGDGQLQSLQAQPLDVPDTCRAVTVHGGGGFRVLHQSLHLPQGDMRDCGEWPSTSLLFICSIGA